MHWRSHSRSSGGWLVLLSFILASTTAYAEDQEPVFFGGQATLTAGALTAYTEEADGFWYNPACLASIERNKVSVSGSNVAVRIRRRPDVLQAELAEGVATASDSHTSMGFIPIGMGLARSLGDTLTIGGGFYLRERDLFETVATLRLDESDTAAPLPELSETSFGLRYQRWKMDIAVGLGWQLSRRVAIGVTFVGNLFTETTDTSMMHQRPEEDWLLPAASGYHLDLQLKSFSFQGFAIFGLQVNLARGWYLGVVYRTSEASLWRRDRVSSQAAFEALESVFSSSTGRRVNGEEPSSWLELISPAFIRVALSYRAERGWIALEGEVGPPHRDEGLGYNEEPYWNVRLGGQFWLREHFSFGGGFFTSNSTSRRPDGVVNPSIDYYGITVGMNFRRSHQVRGREDALVFSTTMAARYALGVGESAGLLFDPYDLAGGYQRGSDTDVMVYDLSWYFGTSILF